MADDVDAKISDALMLRLAGLTLSPPLDVAYPGVPFPAGSDDPKPQAYLEVQEFRNTPQEVTSRETRYRGSLVVEVAVPTAGTVEPVGDIAAKEIAGKVREHFKRGTWIAHGGITVRIDRCFVGSGYRGTDSEGKHDGRWRVPVSARWFCHVTD